MEYIIFNRYKLHVSDSIIIFIIYNVIKCIGIYRL